MNIYKIPTFYFSIKSLIKKPRCCVNILKPALFFSRLESNNVRKMSSSKVSAFYVACLQNFNESSFNCLTFVNALLSEVATFRLMNIFFDFEEQEVEPFSSTSFWETRHQLERGSAWHARELKGWIGRERNCTTWIFGIADFESWK